MATPTALQGIPLPDPTDADNVPYAFAQAVGGFESRLVMRFASSTARDAAITAPVEGMLASIGSKRLTYYDGTAWKDVSGPALPASVSASGPGPNSTTGAAGAWASLTTPVTASITLPAPALCAIRYAAWVVMTGTGDVRGAVNITGATVQSQVALSNGENFMLNFAGTVHQSGTRDVVLNAGTTTVEIQGWKTGTPTASRLDYAGLRITPIRWV